MEWDVHTDFKGEADIEMEVSGFNLSVFRTGGYDPYVDIEQGTLWDAFCCLNAGLFF